MGLVITISAFVLGTAAIVAGVGFAASKALQAAKNGFVHIPKWESLTTTNHPETLQRLSAALDSYHAAHRDYHPVQAPICKKVLREVRIIWRVGDTYEEGLTQLRGHVINARTIAVADRGGLDIGRTALFWEISRLIRRDLKRSYGTHPDIKAEYGQIITRAKFLYAKAREDLPET